MHSTISRMHDSNVDITSTPPPHHHTATAGGLQIVPHIRLIAATPSDASSSFESNVSSPTVHVPQACNIPMLTEDVLGSSSLAPSAAQRKRLVPKKSKLSLLNGPKARETKQSDLSDIARRVGVSSASARGGFDIYVDPSEDPEMGEIVMIKKKKSRAGLDGVFGDASNRHPAPLQESTNAPAPVPTGLPQPKKTSLGPMSLLKRSTGAASMLKSDEENQKWWSLSRGKVSRTKSKEAKCNFLYSRRRLWS